MKIALLPSDLATFAQKRMRRHVQNNPKLWHYTPTLIVWRKKHLIAEKYVGLWRIAVSISINWSETHVIDVSFRVAPPWKSLTFDERAVAVQFSNNKSDSSNLTEASKFQFCVRNGKRHEIPRLNHQSRIANTKTKNNSEESAMALAKRQLKKMDTSSRIEHVPTDRREFIRQSYAIVTPQLRRLYWTQPLLHRYPEYSLANKE